MPLQTGCTIDVLIGLPTRNYAYLSFSFHMTGITVFENDGSNCVISLPKSL